MTVDSLHPVQRPGQPIGRVLRPTSLVDALEAMASDPQIRPIAGGTDLLLDLHRGGGGDPVTLLDLTALDELRDITIAGGSVRLGALTTHNDVAGHPELPVVALPLAQACLEIGSPQLRNRATIAGNLATASPANDTISALLALDAMVSIAQSAASEPFASTTFSLDSDPRCWLTTNSSPPSNFPPSATRRQGFG